MLSFLLAAGIRPGFDKAEYLDLLKLNQQQTDTFLTNVNLPFPENSERLYRSEKGPLINAWDFWMRNDSVGIICLHATRPKFDSWLENFYAGMVPATGSWYLGDELGSFNYQLSADSNAYVHAGWLSGLAYLAPNVLEKINYYYAEGIKDFIIVGHSQGGALAFLMRSWLEYLPEGSYASDVRFKTYCSAAPKPGNLYYAYDFERINFGGWGLRVVHAEDWVPETPFTIQSIEDINERSPFNLADEGFKQLGFVQRLALKSIYNGMDRSVRRARDKFIKNLGKRLGTLIEDRLPGMETPDYAKSMAYATAGTPIILYPDSNYQDYIDAEIDTEFIHHTFAAYYRCALDLPD